MATESHTDAGALRAALRELVALSTIPAAWVGREPPIIAAGLADALVGSLNLDFAFVRLCDPQGNGAIEVTRGQAWKAFPEWLQAHLHVGRFLRKEIVTDIGNEAPCSGLVIPIGVDAEAGLVAAACSRSEFPSDVDQLLLSVAANHAAAAFQNARLRHELDAKLVELGQARHELERKVSERTADLQRSQAYLAESQRLTHCGSFGWNVSSGEIYWSEETYKIFAYDRAVKPTLELVFRRIHPDDRDFVQQIIDRAVDARAVLDFEERLLMPDGSVKYLHVLARALETSSGNLEYVGSVTDFTERNRAEQATRLLAAIVESSRDAIVSKSLDGVITSWNKGAELLFGYSAEEAVGQNITLIIPPERRDEEKMIVALLSRGERVDQFETVRMRKDGSLLDVSLTISPMKDASGRVVGASKLARDITERKRAEEALRQAQTDLAHASRLTTMGEFTASLAHELTQPIAAAVTSASTCLRWLAAEVPNLDKARAAAIRIVNDGTRAAEIISRIRMLFKKGTPQRELVDVNEVAREMIVLLEDEASRHSISVRTELAEDLPHVIGDRVQLQQVLMNLIVNGVDAMHDVNRPRELIIKSQPAENNELLMSVSDTGVGLPRHQADQIFNAFFTTKTHGTGMGLRISRSIIESHGGRLWAADNSPRGATFWFTLPTKAGQIDDTRSHSRSVGHA